MLREDETGSGVTASEEEGDVAMDVGGERGDDLEGGGEELLWDVRRVGVFGDEGVTLADVVGEERSECREDGETWVARRREEDVCSVDVSRETDDGGVCEGVEDSVYGIQVDDEWRSVEEGADREFIL